MTLVTSSENIPKTYSQGRHSYAPSPLMGAASDSLQPGWKACWLGVCWRKPRRRRSTSIRAMTGIGSEDVAASANSAAADLSSLGSPP